jgi:DNA modification methylase
VNAWQIIEGDCRDTLASLEAQGVQTVVTSPPYFGLRDYGHDGQIGLEPTPDEFVAALVGVFREVRRVLRDDGTVWLNLGSSYMGNPGGPQGESGQRASRTFTANARAYAARDARACARTASSMNGNGSLASASRSPGTDASGMAWVNYTRLLKPKDMIPTPWMVAMALQADGWYLRSDIIWAKPNPMPESVTDRPTKAHEYVFLLSKGPRYFYDHAAIREDGAGRLDLGNMTATRAARVQSPGAGPWAKDGGEKEPDGRNRRSVWTVATQPYPGAHFATFPAKLIEPCILAGSREGDTVLDPFAGAGTTGIVALRHDRSFIGLELSPEYARMARERIIDDAPLLNSHAEVAA